MCPTADFERRPGRLHQPDQREHDDDRRSRRQPALHWEASTATQCRAGRVSGRRRRTSRHRYRAGHRQGRALNTLSINGSHGTQLIGRPVVGSVHRSHLGVPRRGVLQAVATTQVGVEPLPPRNTSSSSTDTAPEHVIAAFRSPCRNVDGRQSRHFETSSIRLGHQAFRPPFAVRTVHHPVHGMHMLGLTCALRRR